MIEIAVRHVREVRRLTRTLRSRFSGLRPGSTARNMRSYTYVRFRYWWLFRTVEKWRESKRHHDPGVLRLQRTASGSVRRLTSVDHLKNIRLDN